MVSDYAGEFAVDAVESSGVYEGPASDVFRGVFPDRINIAIKDKLVAWLCIIYGMWEESLSD